MDAWRGSLTRRTLLVGASLGAFGAGLARAVGAKGDSADASADALDAALLRLAEFGPVFAGGLANHGPMVAEALVALGRSDAIAHWVDGYTRRLEPWPRSAGRIARDAWADALGRSEHAADWRALFRDELADGPATDVLVRWLPRLAPGISGSAAHGLIRTGHAVRALDVHATAARRAELADALAYWAASYRTLPDAPHANRGLTVAQALARLERVPPEQRGQGSIVSRLAPLRELPSFAEAADLVDLRADPAVALSDVTSAFARVYCDNAAQPDGRIARLHAVTGSSALRPLLPHLPAAAQRPLLRWAWQLGAAVYATHTQPGAHAPAIEPFATSADLVAAAVDTGDEHAIKLTEVCLRELALRQDPVFAPTATHWVRASA